MPHAALAQAQHRPLDQDRGQPQTAIGGTGTDRPEDAEATHVIGPGDAAGGQLAVRLGDHQVQFRVVADGAAQRVVDVVMELGDRVGSADVVERVGSVCRQGGATSSSDDGVMRVGSSVSGRPFPVTSRARCTLSVA